MITPKLHKYNMMLMRKIKKRNVFQKLIDLIWFYWYLGGDVSNAKLEIDSDASLSMSGESFKKYSASISKKKKRATYLFNYYVWIKTNKKKRK